MATHGKDPITCHVLDTTSGRPAKSIRVLLEGPSQSSTSSTPKTFESLTDEDGRVRVWQPCSTGDASAEAPVHTLADVLKTVKGPSRWTLRFDTAGYFGDESTFFPEATIVFRVEEGQTYHVPLLLSPYSYTTYRGS
ncbi:hypothetical protein NLU13_4477 [Sarocladium strictum]|uniref:5-hydroxyisourate hydrolase n=1 Tax=Sarocladium strictum TaxID=5046 RepID=A0AA39L8P7_SARSR|nr:hypothetical protein NLU13_4477 [Sarocladium strictum]